MVRNLYINKSYNIAKIFSTFNHSERDMEQNSKNPSFDRYYKNYKREKVNNNVMNNVMEQTLLERTLSMYIKSIYKRWRQT